MTRIHLAVTVAPTFNMGDGAAALIEYRVEHSDEDVYDGNSEDSNSSLAVEFTFAF